MIVRTIFLMISLTVSATQVPRLLEIVMEARNGNNAGQVAPVDKASAPKAGAPGQVVLKADGRGHYTGSFRINGKTFEGLVDTGASYVALNESMARRLGFGVNSLDFRHTVSTANGQTKAAMIKLDRVEIGPVRVRDVDAMVLRDNALSTMLIGMSFLRQLETVASRDGTLRLGS